MLRFECEAKRRATSSLIAALDELQIVDADELVSAVAEFNEKLWLLSGAIEYDHRALATCVHAASDFYTVVHASRE